MKTNAPSYELRANPKKSLRVSDPHSNTSTSTRLHNDDIVCRICGKGFEKMRQLCGHLRHCYISNGEGGGRVFKCKECGKRFKSIRALCGHMKCHGIGAMRVSDVSVIDCSLFLIGNVGVRKRPRTPRFDVSRRNHFDLSSSDLNHEEDDTEFEESGLQEVAASLIMMSKGFEFSALNGNLNAVELVDEGSKSNGLETVEMDGGSCEMELNVCENPVELKNIGSDLRVIDEGYVGQHEMQGVESRSSDHVKPGDGFGGGVSGSVLKYRCISCNKEFSTHQGLGGHRSSKHHRLPRCLKAQICQRTIHVAEGTSKMPECAADDVQKDDLRTGVVPHFELLKKCKRKPDLCFKVCSSSLALGDHMGACVAKSSPTDQDQRPVSEQMRRSSALKIASCKSIIQPDHISVTQGIIEKPECSANDMQEDERFAVSSANFELLMMCNQECSVCFKVFSSSQALGTHMGAHFTESSAVDHVQQPGESMQGTAVAELSMISQSPIASRKMIVS